MSRVAHWLQQSLIQPTPAGNILPNVGAIGLELELEGNCRWPFVDGWRQEQDGSLRGGIEYVFDGPQMGADAEQSIQNMHDALVDLRGLNPSFRCSTHIHMDVKSMEVDQVEKLVLAYIMMEPVLFDHCNMERRYSNFCTPMYINTAMTRMFSRLFSNPRWEERHKVHNMGQWPKYSALNLKPMVDYGSVEFRGSHAMTTRDELLDLACRMLNIKRLALESPSSQTKDQFVQAVRSMSLMDIFPRGLREGYVPEEGLMDKCFASTLSVIHQASSGSMDNQGFALPTPPPRRSTASNDRFAGSVRIDPGVMERYNLFVPPNLLVDFDSLIRMVSTLRNIQGMVPPRLVDFCPTWQDYMSSGLLIRTLSAHNLTPRDVGF